jgi:hypothetical protein
MSMNASKRKERKDRKERQKGSSIERRKEKNLFPFSKK